MKRRKQWMRTKGAGGRYGTGRTPNQWLRFLRSTSQFKRFGKAPVEYPIGWLWCIIADWKEDVRLARGRS